MNRTERREMMLGHVDAWKASGESRKNYCARHGLNLSVMNYWCVQASKRMHASGFAVVELVADECVELHYPNGVRLVLPAGMALSQVAAYIRSY
jgi:hypothetical protein